MTVTQHMTAVNETIPIPSWSQKLNRLGRVPGRGVAGRRVGHRRSPVPLMTADHHGRGTTPFVIAWEATVHDALGAKTSVANISSAEGTATTRPCPRRPRGQRRPGSAASDTGPLLSPDARPKIWRRSGRWKTRRTTRRRGTADDQLSRPRRPVYPRARFRPSSPAGAWSLNSGDSPEIPASP